MAVECAFAETGEVFAASQDVGGAQSGKELTSVGNGLARIGGDGARTHHAARGFEGKIEDGGEVDVESEGAAVFSEKLAMLAEKFAVTGGEDIGRRRAMGRERRGSGRRGHLRDRRK